jgi:hypothetical protein
MSISRLLRAACIAVPAALAGGSAMAQQILAVPGGTIVVVATGTIPAQAMAGRLGAPVLVQSRVAQPDPVSPSLFENFFAEQQKTMDRMMAAMDAMFSPAADAAGTIRAMVGDAARGVVPAAGGSFCAESISISYGGRDTAPVVKVSRAGDGCGAGAGVAPIPAETAPPAVHRPNVIEVNDPARVAQPPVRHRT